MNIRPNNNPNCHTELVEVFQKCTQNMYKGIILLVASFLLTSNISFAQGPNAPEAAAFEPVDATDMVNLLTGDMSYVLPLLNIPSPEGGYPLTLSYHGGIAHNQEASWTGLGWNLNPGTINRNINGLPDDWGKTKYDEFFYDAGWTEDEYNLSVGVTINGTLSIGLGASWGSHRSIGGFVSLGYSPDGGVGTSINIGTDGVGFGVGYKGFNASVSTNGVGIGYGGTFNKNSNAGFGVNLNYNYNSGLSGGFSIGSYNKAGGKAKFSSLGINFNSNGASIKGQINGQGIGLSTTNLGITSQDYDIHVSGFQAVIPIYTFYIGFGHTRTKYSLYKKNNLTSSGSVYPYHANQTKLLENGMPSYLMDENFFMDVNEFLAFSSKDMSLDYLVEQNYKEDKNNISIPGYDNYTVTSQGLSGSIKPASFHELNLIGRGKAETNNDNIYNAYVANNFDGWLDSSNDLGTYTHFYFENEFSSFLRMERSQIYKKSITNDVSDYTLLNGFETADTDTYNQQMSQLKYGNRKRTGSYIETFTNKQIRDNSSIGFIEARNIKRQLETDTFLNEGIGAFRITAIDGKTYHYSLPVYNFELFYKNFENETNENKNFFEIQKTKPYATHWLLTAITGPDYVDINTNGELDKDDYGYWVEFDYGKWSDGYVWKGPVDGFEEHVNKKDSNKKSYSYYWGRKQIYYLDAVKTRTHIALFIKDLKADNLSSTSINTYKNIYTGGDFDVAHNSKVYTSERKNWDKTTFGKPRDTVYGSKNEKIKLTWYQNDGDTIMRQEYRGDKSTYKYINIPRSRTMKLSKVLLLKNKDISPDLYKKRGELTKKITGNYSLNVGFTGNKLCGYFRGSSGNHDDGICNSVNDRYSNIFLNKIILKEVELHKHDKVLDIKDIEGLNLEKRAVQVIDFNYDYSLAQQSPNSLAHTEGRLSLRSVNFKGKTGISLIPPYRFNYSLPSVKYNKQDQDEWGYHKTEPQAWSLNEIITPTGGKIKIKYESDSYYSEAAYNPAEKFDDIKVTKEENSKILKIKFNNQDLDLSKYFGEGIETELTLTEKKFKYRLGNWSPSFSKNYTLKVKIISISTINKEVIVELIKDEGIIIFNNPLLPPTIHQKVKSFPFIAIADTCKRIESETDDNDINTYCYFDPIIKSTQAPNLNYTNTNPNGREGGGIRVANIEIQSENIKLKTVYDYTNLANDNISGITSYAPSKDQKGIPYVSELPAPLITYGNVTMKNYDTNNTFLGSTSYEFDVLKPFEENSDYIFCLGDFFKVEEQQNENFFDEKVRAKKYTIYNKIGDIGRVLSVASYNKHSQLLNKTVSNYKVNLDDDGQIGVSQQSYKSIKKLKKDDLESFLITSSSKVDYPSVLKSTTTIQGGFTNTTHYNKFDFLTGNATETRAISSDGSEFKTKVIPAYSIPKYSGYLDSNNDGNTDGYGMGSKIDNPTNKNMLTQTAANTTHIKDGDTWKTISANINTWNNDWTYRSNTNEQQFPDDQTNQEKIWRKHQSFAWKGELDEDGAYKDYMGDDDNFNWTNPNNQTNSKWINTSTVNLYDHYSMPLESQDINGNKAATKMGDNDSKIFVSCNAGYTEMYYSGAEDLIEKTNYFSGQVSKGVDALISDTFHTGSKGLKVAPNIKAFIVKPTTGNYKVSVWAYKGLNTNYTNTKLKVGDTVMSYTSSEVVHAGDWAQLNFNTGEIDIADTEVYVYSTQGDVIYDDFRLLPIASSMVSYVYNEWDELTYIIGANNLAAKYEYDAAGRLKKTYNEVIDTPEITGGFKISTSVQYKYKNQ